MSRWEIRPRLPFGGLALSALAGILFAEWVVQPAVWIVAGVVAVLGALAWWKRTAWAAWLFTAAAFFGLHDIRHFHAEARLVAQELGAAPRVAKAVGIVWSEPVEAKATTRTTGGSFVLKVESLDVRRRVRPVEALVQARWNGPLPVYGDRVRVLGSMMPLPPPRNEGQFDYAGWQHRRGIYSELQARYEVDCEIIGHGEGSWVTELALGARRWVAQKLELDLEDSPEVSALIKSMILGLQGDTPEETKELFQQTGTMHLFAVSGLNVAILGWLALKLLHAVRVPRRAAVLIVVPLLAVYALITGLSASCVRACIMGGLVYLAYVFDRNPSPLNGVAAAGVAILAWDTNQLFSPGFQFSFVLVIVLLGCATFFTRKMVPWGQPDAFLPRQLWNRRQRVQAVAWKTTAEAVGVSVASWFGSLAFTGIYFHLISPVTVFANVLAVPISLGILALGVASLLAGSVSTSFAMIFNNANWLCTKALLVIVKFFAGLPLSYFYFATAELERPVDWELAVLDVGSGGATFVHTREANWLIDCGHANDYDRIVKPFLRARGVNGMTGLVLTHGDSQHIGGALELLEKYRGVAVIDSPLKDRSTTRRSIHTTLEKRDQPKRIVQRGDAIPLGAGLRATVLYPPADLVRSAADDKALVLRLDDGHTRVLLVSDSGFSTEQWLLANEPDLRADILIKGEHAKDLSGSPDFLRAVQPRLIVVTAPDRYRPTATRDAWLREVSATGMTLFRQERTGEVRVKMRAEGFEARGFVDGQILTSRAR